MISSEVRTPDDSPFVPRLIPSAQVTRRKRMTFILKSQSEVVWSGTSFADALQWLQENDFEHVEVLASTAIWSLEFIKPLKETDGDSWREQPLHY